MTDRTIMKLEFVERTHAESGNITWVIRSDPYHWPYLMQPDRGAVVIILTQLAQMIAGNQPLLMEPFDDGRGTLPG